MKRKAGSPSSTKETNGERNSSLVHFQNKATGQYWWLDNEFIAAVLSTAFTAKDDFI